MWKRIRWEGVSSALYIQSSLAFSGDKGLCNQSPSDNKWSWQNPCFSTFRRWIPNKKQLAANKFLLPNVLKCADRPKFSVSFWKAASEHKFKLTFAPDPYLLPCFLFHIHELTLRMEKHIDFSRRFPSAWRSYVHTYMHTFSCSPADQWIHTRQICIRNVEFLSIQYNGACIPAGSDQNVLNVLCVSIHFCLENLWCCSEAILGLSIPEAAFFVAGSKWYLPFLMAKSDKGPRTTHVQTRTTTQPLNCRPQQAGTSSLVRKSSQVKMLQISYISEIKHRDKHIRDLHVISTGLQIDQEFGLPIFESSGTHL